MIPALLKEGSSVNLFDPEGMEEAKKYFIKNNKIFWFKDSYSAMKGSDALVILTEWNQFRALNLQKVKTLLNNPILVDLRNIYDPKEVIDFGFSYFSIGRPTSLFK